MNQIKIRTKHAERCYEQINLLEGTYRTHVQDLDEVDVVHYADYISYLKDLHSDGMFDLPDLLDSSDWDDDYNVRYDYYSIRGTHGEMIVHMARNRCGGDARSRSCSSTKANELAGWDGEVYNTVLGWEGVYLQSKLLNMRTEDDEELVKIYHGYLNPKYTAHRLALPSIENRMFIEMSLPILRNDVITDPDKRLVHSTITEYWNDKPRKVSFIYKHFLVERRKKFEFTEYWLK